MPRPYVNFYYDWTWVQGEGGKYTSDTEGNLVQLCDACARQAGREVSFASRGDEPICEVCDATDQEGGDRG